MQLAPDDKLVPQRLLVIEKGAESDSTVTELALVSPLLVIVKSLVTESPGERFPKLLETTAVIEREAGVRLFARPVRFSRASERVTPLKYCREKLLLSDWPTKGAYCTERWQLEWPERVVAQSFDETVKGALGLVKEIELASASPEFEMVNS